MTTTVTVSTIYRCSLERAFKTPMLCDVAKVHTGFGVMPRVTHCTDDDDWGQPGSSKKVFAAPSLTFKGGEASTDNVLERIDNQYWKIEVNNFKSWMLGFYKFVGEWKTTELGYNQVRIDYTYTLHTNSLLLYPLNWLFTQLFWKRYMKQVLENVRALAYENEPYFYPKAPPTIKDPEIITIDLESFINANKGRTVSGVERVFALVRPQGGLYYNVLTINKNKFTSKKDALLVLTLINICIGEECNYQDLDWRRLEPLYDSFQLSKSEFHEVYPSEFNAIFLGIIEYDRGAYEQKKERFTLYGAFQYQGVHDSQIYDQIDYFPRFDPQYAMPLQCYKYDNDSLVTMYFYEIEDKFVLLNTYVVC